MELKELNKMTGEFSSTDKMPVLFLGHGSPMNAIEENDFVKGFRKIGDAIPRPNAILCISAHWETRGTFATVMEKPKTIHDFGGFPKELYEIQYPAPGSPSLAYEIKKIITKTEVGLDTQWGLDHGSWSVVKHLYPNADVPIIQLSLDHFKGPQYHFDLAKELAPMRKKGILIVGSGNVVHNLRLVAWNKLNEPGFGYDWAIEADHKIKNYILNGESEKLIDYESQGKAFELSIPTPEHYLPLLYALSLKEKNDEIRFFNDKTVGGSLSMTSLRIGS